MKFVRFLKGNTEYRGIIEDDIITRINGTIFHDYTITEDRYNINDIKILTPILPSKVIGFKKNYKIEGNPEIELPQLFLKPSTSIIATDETIIIPPDGYAVSIEGEIAIVIGKKCHNIKKEQATEYILGATIGNDITSKNITACEGKAYDTFTPIGGYIDTRVDYNNIRIKTTINGATVQDGVSSNMIFKVDELISYTSKIMTLLPGDILLTGTPSSSVKVNDGDEVIITIDGLGSLKNKVKQG